MRTNIRVLFVFKSLKDETPLVFSILGRHYLPEIALLAKIFDHHVERRAGVCCGCCRRKRVRLARADVTSVIQDWLASKGQSASVKELDTILRKSTSAVKVASIDLLSPRGGRGAGRKDGSDDYHGAGTGTAKAAPSLVDWAAGG